MPSRKLDLVDDALVAGERIALAITVGEDYRLDLQMLETDGVTATNITGWTFESEIRDSAGALVATFAVAVTVGASGTFAATLASAVTAALTPSLTHKYDLWRTNAGNKTPLLHGTVHIRPSITEL